MQTQTIQGPMLDLVQKWTRLQRCRVCDGFILVIFSSDGTYFGAHYSSIYAQFPEDELAWTCNKCYGEDNNSACFAEIGGKKQKKKRIGFCRG